MRRTTCVIAALTMALLTMGDIATAVEATLWKAGVAKVKITPQGPYFAAGYGGEKRIATEKHHDLWIKVLALEDAQGQRGLLITSDICGFDRVSYDAICTGLKQRCGLDRAQIILNSTHNHSGPVTRNSLMPFHDFTLDDLHRIGVYSREIEQKAIDAAAEAFGCLVPATLSLGAGQADFAVNRRNNRDADIPKRLPHLAPLRGPVDHRVPVIAVRSPAGGLLAVVFAYACHPVMTAESVWSGDFPGFAMLDLEQAHPKVMALFCQGCGGDQNCIRGPIALAREQGRLLATAVEQALAKPMTRIEPRLATTGVTILLDYERVVTGQELEAVLQAEDPGTGAKARWARQVLAELKDRGRLPTGYSYPMQAWKLGTKTLWVALSGEPLVDYALTLQKQFGPETLVTGCCSDLMAYIPTRRIWEEACGEEVMYLWEYGRPAYRWAGDVEPRILAAVEQMARRLITELARTLGISTNGVFRILRCLAQRGDAEADPAGGCRLGTKFFTLGRRLQARFDLRRRARPQLERLCEGSDETVQLNGSQEDHALVLDCLTPSASSFIQVLPGSRMAVHANAFSKAVLAFLPEDEARRRLPRKLAALTPNTITDKEKLFKELAQIRATGLVYDHEEYMLGIHCIGAPVFDVNGVPAAGVGITGLVSVSHPEKQATLQQAVLKCAEAISRDIGYEGGRFAEFQSPLKENQ